MIFLFTLRSFGSFNAYRFRTYFDYLRPVAVYTLVAWEQFVVYAAEELRMDEGAAFACHLHSREPH